MVVADGDIARIFYCILLSLATLQFYGIYELFISSSDDLLAEALQLITLLNFIATLGTAVGQSGHLGTMMVGLQVVALVVGAALVYTDIHREKAALLYMADEAKKHLEEYGVDLSSSCLALELQTLAANRSPVKRVSPPQWPVVASSPASFCRRLT